LPPVLFLKVAQKLRDSTPSPSTPLTTSVITLVMAKVTAPHSCSPAPALGRSYYPTYPRPAPGLVTIPSPGAGLRREGLRIWPVNADESGDRVRGLGPRRGKGGEGARGRGGGGPTTRMYALHDALLVYKQPPPTEGSGFRAYGPWALGDHAGGRKSSPSPRPVWPHSGRFSATKVCSLSVWWGQPAAAEKMRDCGRRRLCRIPAAIMKGGV
jgi:hypothetical protein